MLFRKKLSTRERMVKDLEKALKKSSRHKMPAEVRHELAVRTVSRLNFDNPFQMQCSLESYADSLTMDYNRKLRTY